MMSYRTLLSAFLISLPLSFSLPGLLHAENATVSKLLDIYKTQGAAVAEVKNGEILWKKTYISKGEFPERSCTTCHTEDLTKIGEHVKTGKKIEPMSPSINPDRLTSIKKINKWFKRNCKWTMGRECTVQEKANILVYIENQTKF